MPDHDRKLSFMHTLSQDPGDGAARCPNCRGTAGVTFQADCVCCGREMAPSAEDITNGVKALSTKTEEAIPDGRLGSSQPHVPSFVEESKPIIPVAAAGPRPSSERQLRHSTNVPILRSSYNHSERSSGVGAREGKFASLPQLQQQQQQQQPGSGDSGRRAVRIGQLQPHYVVGQASSSNSRSLGSPHGAIVTRGRSSRGSGGRGAGSGAHPSYRGVRTRKGVRGYLVEIRPPKWKRTIWLGTYNTSAEAAAAYDAGVYYTKRSNTKLYNFPVLEGAFPPLPPHLRLDRRSDVEEIKLFVQREAKTAARLVACRMGNTSRTPQPAHLQTRTTTTSNHNQVEPTSSGSCLTGNSDSADSVSAMTADLQAASISSTSSEVNIVDDSATEFSNMPMDFDFLAAEEAAKMFSDYNNYVSLQQGHDHETSLLEELDAADR